jgi:hypothetical protein
MYYRSFRKYGKVLEINYLVTLKKCAKLENKECLLVVEDTVR